MNDKHMCDCNQGRLVCRCKEPAIVPYSSPKPNWYVEQHEKFIFIRCDFYINGIPAGCGETVSRSELGHAEYPEMAVMVRIDAMDRRRQRMIGAEK